MRVPGRALKLGSSLSAKLHLTVQPVCGTSSTRARQVLSAALPSRARVTRGSAFETTHDAETRSPPSSSTPAPGMMRATGALVKTTAPASRAMSQRMNETMPIPPST